MDPITGAAMISGGAQLIGNTGANIANQNMSNRQRHWNQRMINEQREWDLQNWNRVNQYNSPQAQMARFKEAGLNPHLIYGKGTAGNANNLSSPDVKGYDRPQMKSVTQGMTAFGDIYRFKNIQAQTDNTKEQTALLGQEQLLKAAQTAETAVRAQRGFLDYGIAKELRETTAEAARVGLQNAQENLKQNIDKSTISRQTVQEKIKQVKNTTSLQDLEKQIKQFEVNLNKKGLTKTDSKIWRMISTEADNIKKGKSSTLSTLKDLLIQAWRWNFGVNTPKIDF